MNDKNSKAELAHYGLFRWLDALVELRSNRRLDHRFALESYREALYKADGIPHK